MKVQYFEGTDTLLITLGESSIVETRELAEHVLVDLDSTGSICSITVEHASTQAGAPQFAYEIVPG